MFFLGSLPLFFASTAFSSPLDVSVQLYLSVRHNVLPSTAFDLALDFMLSLFGDPNRPIAWWLTHQVEFDWLPLQSSPHGG
jgi:hypothetical protein